jgi:hypothetical protein
MHCSGTHLNMGDMGLLSTINEKEKDRWHSETFTEVEVDVIDFKTLLDITKFTTIDFISIDAEGSDYRILEQIDLKALNCSNGMRGIQQHRWDEICEVHGAIWI